MSINSSPVRIHLDRSSGVSKLKYTRFEFILMIMCGCQPHVHVNQKGGPDANLLSILLILIVTDPDFRIKPFPYTRHPYICSFCTT